MRFRAGEAAAAIGARLVGPDVVVDGASFDSRSIRTGQLFVPIVAGRDGHDFIPAALAAGAAAYLTTRAPVGGTALVVDDTSAALMRLGAFGRGRLSGPVVGVTGSVGKTSTKDLMVAALAGSYRVAANERSFNNEQGLPVTILGAPDDTQVTVVEMGMRGPGEIARLCAVARPTIGVVTAVGAAHTERVGGLDGVAKAKAELIAALPPAGTAVLNADDHRVAAMASVAAGPVVTFGASPHASVRLRECRLDSLARACISVSTPWGELGVQLGVSGRHMAMNACAAIAVAGVVGCDMAAVTDGLAEGVVSAMRMSVTTTGSGALVVDDTYNANPTSMRAAIDALGAVRAERRVAVLGVMAELADSAREHIAIAAYADQRGVELIAVGTDLYGVAPASFPDAVALLRSLAGGDAVLVKGSRAAGMERIVEMVLVEER